jgi:dTDP-glucose 4,6-dehydratase
VRNRRRGDRQARFGLHRPHPVLGFVTDRPGHDQRYAIDCSKLKRDLGWSQAHVFDQGLRHTVRWHLEHRDWVQSVRTGEYRKWIEANYTSPGRT